MLVGQVQRVLVLYLLEVSLVIVYENVTYSGSNRISYSRSLIDLTIVFITTVNIGYSDTLDIVLI